MSKRDKLRQKLRDHPKGRTKQEVFTLLLQFGFRLDRVSGSHHLFLIERDTGIHRLVVPVHGNHIKQVYVRLAIEMIDSLYPEDDEGNQDE